MKYNAPGRIMIPLLLLVVLAPDPDPIDAYYAGQSLPPADDYDFLRRLTLDLTGRLPTPDAIRAFIADGSPDKRLRAIDAMLEGDAHAEFYGDLWMRALVNYELNELDPFRVNFTALRRWLIDAVRRDMPLDAFTRAVVASSGDAYTDGAVNYAMKHVRGDEPPIDVTERTVQVFLGLPIQCAQCHDHPFEPYTRDQYWGLAGFFKDTRPNIRKTFDGMKYGIKDRPGKPIPIPAMAAGSVAEPKFLDGRVPLEGRTLRESLAEFIITVGERQFARNHVNRTWAHFMGWGFNTPLDAFGKTAARRDEALMESLTDAFVAAKHSPRALIRLIVTSKAYQLACTAPVAERIKPVKPMTVPQMLNVITTVYNLEPFIKILYSAFAGNKDLPESYKQPEVFRMYLYQYVTDLLAAQRQPGDELKSPGSVRLALRFMNNTDLQGAMFAHGGPYMNAYRKSKEPAVRIEELYLGALGRPPTEAEKTRALEHVATGPDPVMALQDVYWVLLNSSEFFFIH